MGDLFNGHINSDTPPNTREGWRRVANESKFTKDMTDDEIEAAIYRNTKQRLATLVLELFSLTSMSHPELLRQTIGQVFDLSGVESQLDWVVKQMHFASQRIQNQQIELDRIAEAWRGMEEQTSTLIYDLMQARKELREARAELAALKGPKSPGGQHAPAPPE